MRKFTLFLISFLFITLSLSAQITSKDLTPKCIKCNTKIKSGWKFCPQCGTETSTLDITKEFLGSLSKDELIKMLIEK
jgi:predicted amidophosphoribosyltransferase